MARQRIVRPKPAPSRGLAQGRGSDFASRWPILDCRAEAMSDKSARFSI
jgi:hypothetical protein